MKRAVLLLLFMTLDKISVLLSMQTFWLNSAETQRYVSAGFAVVSSSKIGSLKCDAKDMICQALVFSHICSLWVQSTHVNPCFHLAFQQLTKLDIIKIWLWKVGILSHHGCVPVADIFRVPSCMGQVKCKDEWPLTRQNISRFLRENYCLSPAVKNHLVARRS